MTPEPLSTLAGRVLVDAGEGSFQLGGTWVAWAGPESRPAVLVDGVYVVADRAATDPDDAASLAIGLLLAAEVTP